MTICTYTGAVIFLLGGVMARGAESDSSYIQNIRNYVDNVQSYRFHVSFEGNAQNTVENIGLVNYDAKREYDLLYDKQKALWKYTIKKEDVPRGQYSEEQLGILLFKEYKTTSHSRNGTAEYWHPGTGYGLANVAFLMGDQESREAPFKYAMQLIDPMNWVRKAIPKSKSILHMLEHTEETTKLTYAAIEGHSDKYRIVELSKQFGYLPTKIYSAGNGWGPEDHEIFYEISYANSESGFVVTQIKYQKKDGTKGLLKYDKPVYNSDIPDEEFNIDIPADATLFNHKGELLASSDEAGKASGAGSKDQTDTILNAIDKKNASCDKKDTKLVTATDSTTTGDDADNSDSEEWGMGSTDSQKARIWGGVSVAIIVALILAGILRHSQKGRARTVVSDK